MRFRLFVGLLAVTVAAGCKAQTKAAPNPDLNRRIEVMVRSQFNIPPEVSVKLGQRSPSDMPGYDKLPVTLSHGARSQVVDFLVSNDNKTLARLEKFDLEKSPAFNIDVTGRPIRGNPNAKVTVISFDDLECPFCARMHQQLFPGTLDRYKNQVRFIYKDDPLTEIHPWAMHAAVDANCLADQSGDVYWKYVDYLHSHGEEINGTDRNLTKSYAALDRIAQDEATVAKLDGKKLDTCIAKQDQANINTSRQEADALGVNGTPALFVNGERIDGAVPEEQVWAVIDRALRDAGEQPPAAPAEKAPATQPSGK